ncbi:MAG TPA: DUF4340 domain-containing protein [Hyphomicrobiaceae bacterium]|jgi:hypothetical protein|nr:DUF4340 domain-containing protein [Hyphomicrobiaceae bacterium]
MTPKSFVYLAAAAVVSALFAIVTFAANNPWGSGPVAGEKLMPTLAGSIGQVAEVAIRQGEDGVVLERTGGTWSLKSRGGYPVDVVKVRALLVGLDKAELVEPKTSRAEKYAALELEDPAGKGAKSRLVKVTDAKGNTIAEAVLGKKRSEGYGTGKTGGTYVRRPGNPQTWLANAELDAPVATKDWVKASVLALDSAKINRVSIEIPGEPALRVERPAPAPAKDAAATAKDAKDAKATEKADAKVDLMKLHQMSEPPAPPAPPAKLAFVGFPTDGKKLKDASAAESLARAVASIDLEDLRKLAAPPSGDGASVVKIESADGVVTTLRLRKEGDAHWLTVATTGGEGDGKKAADEIAARTKDWEFKIPGWKADAILKKRADLIEASGS